MFRGSGYRFGAKNIRQSAHVPAKWVPVRRQEHAPIDESRAGRPRKAGEGDFPQAARDVKVAAATGARGTARRMGGRAGYANAAVAGRGRRRPPVATSRAFSGEVQSGSPSKMRPRIESGPCSEHL